MISKYIFPTTGCYFWGPRCEELLKTSWTLCWRTSSFSAGCKKWSTWCTMQNAQIIIKRYMYLYCRHLAAKMKSKVGRLTCKTLQNHAKQYMQNNAKLYKQKHTNRTNKKQMDVQQTFYKRLPKKNAYSRLLTANMSYRQYVWCRFHQHGTNLVKFILDRTIWDHFLNTRWMDKFTWNPTCNIIFSTPWT